MAIVFENVPKASGLTQTASLAAQITQQATGASNSNFACVYQAVSIDGTTNVSGKKGTPVTVTLNAHQSVAITQDAHGGGNTLQSATLAGACDSGNPLTQSQTLSSTATGSSSITQNENDADSGPNVSLDIKQNQSAGYFGDAATTGLNKAAFSQTNVLTAIANTPGPSVSQTQSSPSGGISANVNQFSHGKSTANATQSETQCAHAQTSGSPTCTAGSPPSYSLTQTQYGPVKNAAGKSATAASRSFAFVRKDPGSTQGDNSQDTFTINQSSTQSNDTGQNQMNEVQGACTTSGNCTSTQTTNENGQQTQTTQSGQNVNSSINCPSGSSCTATAPPTPIIDSGPDASTTSTSATFTFHDADPTATFLCRLDTGGYSPCSTGQSYTGLSAGSHTFYVKATDQYGNASAPATYSWTIASGGSANVLVAGTGDVGSTVPNDNLTQQLTSAGYSVTESASLPADLSTFGQVWWIASNAPTSGEQNQLIDFVKSGRGVFLTGERPCCEALNAADQSIVNSVVVGGGITVGGQGDVCSCNTPLPVNPDVVGNVANQPFTVTTWQPAAPGGMANVPASSVFAYYQPGDLSTRQVAAAVWDRSSITGNGRLAVFMDINWTEPTYRATNWSDVAENVAFFLSGLGSPPSPPGP
ncbi:MAG TPA: hypothetical protein VF225_00890 [Gaiellaceae bacterium]